MYSVFNFFTGQTYARTFSHEEAQRMASAYSLKYKTATITQDGSDFVEVYRDGSKIS